jgi:parvulin-like peptidyl-prolyl isomerase
MRALRDPLVIFLLIGALLLIASRWYEGGGVESRIVITAADLNRLSDQWETQMRRPPTDDEMKGLLDSFIREEIYYREAMRMGLDADDTIVRRRLVQKLTFLTEDVATAKAPDEAILREFYVAHPGNYTQPPRISFVHRYFSVDRRAAALADAQAAVKDEALADDPFMLQKSYAQRSEREIGDLFGRPFAAELFALGADSESGGWLGPLRSAYGWHVVRVEEKLGAEMQPFETVRDRIVADWQMQARKAANDAYFESLQSRYAIELPAP